MLSKQKKKKKFCLLITKIDLYFDVVAPPINKGIVKFNLCISFATAIISSNDGVIKPDKPIKSAFSSLAILRILSHGVITPKSITR
jgi:hypothetical protein